MAVRFKQAFARDLTVSVPLVKIKQKCDIISECKGRIYLCEKLLIRLDHLNKKHEHPARKQAWVL
jgi:hypothetical protein